MGYGYEDLTTEELAYIAGIIDGEGCICCYQWKDRNTEKNHDTLRLLISMTCEKTIDWLSEKLSAPVHSKARDKIRKPIWTLSLSGRRVASLLRQCLPYLVTKQEQAEVAIEIGETIIYKGGAWQKVPTDVRELRARLSLRLKELKAS